MRSLGWGQYDENGKQSQFLKQVDLRFHSAYPDCTCPDFYVLRTMVGKEGQDTCKGDSGECYQNYKLCIDIFNMGDERWKEYLISSSFKDNILTQEVPSSLRNLTEPSHSWVFSLEEVLNAPNLATPATTGKTRQGSGCAWLHSETTLILSYFKKLSMVRISQLLKRKRDQGTERISNHVKYFS